ncbi:MAG: zinc ribbon domain-containing protein, partial [Anaerolineae bacterium]|nr:zinc ribbon domain-containing protein [Anaerolineae bacterium]
ACQSCGNPQPPDVEFYQLEDAALLTDENKIKAAQVGPDVHCPYCGTRNTADAKVCFRCGGDLIDAHQRVAGRVLGTFSTDENKTKTELACPACQQPNAANVNYCVHCGSPLKAAPEPARGQNHIQAASMPAKQAPTGKKKISPILIIVIAVVILGCIGALILSLIFGGGGKEPVIATVSNVSWKVTIDIEEQRYVEQEDWERNVPAGAQYVSCQEELYSTSQNYTAGAVEVCGEPYTVDLGNGNAEVRQDCEYEIYENYCSYEVLDWTVVDSVVYEGYDNDPFWSEPNLSTGQVKGSTTEVYLVEFSGTDRNYDYYPDDLYEFQQLTPGSSWELTLNLFGGIQSISPVK